LNAADDPTHATYISKDTARLQQHSVATSLVHSIIASHTQQQQQHLLVVRLLPMPTLCDVTHPVHAINHSGFTTTLCRRKLTLENYAGDFGYSVLQ